MLTVLQVTPLDNLSTLVISVICIAVLLFFLVWVYVCIWVYRDAEKRNSSGALWAILVFFFNIIPLIIWLVVRPPIPPQYGHVAPGYMPAPPPPVYQPCPQCGQPMTIIQQYNRWYCNYCRKYP
ncbi:MAG: hypothetical protein KKH41_00925 [Candidatus Thermoplasmatota archaeon]|nr:hypothetical protein [Euryarchaeota archaeon]MBU4032995.1 hypothetical protein [Candidatus Thermoplasmatota archaeon]MBU4071088.1 hypothetical protein [Candidatus Thermoplasmatota archaeon]MBU4145173.1 hypothetical protein [Candidatus Thermoplasmatota archaeon]MBU4591124.1 hypothetical protein [Candidatus Thermoplasmatota archaeon]